MPTPNKAIDTLLRRYGVDPRNDASAEQFFETLHLKFTDEDIERIGDFLLAAESSKFDYVRMADYLPEGKDDQKRSSMNKTRLAAAVARQAGLSQKASAKVVEAVFASIASSLKSGEKVRLVGFGSFSITHRKASTGRNPRTGEHIQITAHKQLKFKAGKRLKDAVN